MSKLAIAVMMVLAVALTGCIPLVATDRIVGSGRLATRDYSLEGFRAVQVDQAFKAELTQGDTYKVTITTDDNLMDYVIVKKEGDTLRIGLDTGRLHPFSSHTQEAKITLPALRAVHLNGASQATMSGFGKTEQFEAELDGASRLTGDVQAAAVTLRANGASRFSLTGSTTGLTVAADGASRADLGSLSADNVTVNLNGASQGTVKAQKRLDYRLDGASQLRYSGDPAIGQAESNGASRAAHQ